MEISKLKDVIYELVNVAEYEFTPTYFKNIDNACVEICEKLDKLANYEDKQEQGLLIEPKCRVGGYVYYPVVDYNYIFPVRISQIIISDVGNGKSVFQYNGITFDGNGDAYEEYEFDDNDFGVRVFLTESEAEEALAKMGGK